MDKCTDVPLKDQLQKTHRVGGWSSPALIKKALDEIERLEKLDIAHEAAWDALVEHLDYAGEQYEHSDIVAMIAKLRPSAEEWYDGSV